jgi:hypothetical protein
MLYTPYLARSTGLSTRIIRPDDRPTHIIGTLWWSGSHTNIQKAPSISGTWSRCGGSTTRKAVLNLPQNIFTDVELHDPEALARLTLCIGQILRKPQANWLLKSDNVDLVLDILAYDKTPLKCAYYFVDHAKRVVFWLDDFHMNELDAWRTLPGITSATLASQ